MRMTVWRRRRQQLQRMCGEIRSAKLRCPNGDTASCLSDAQVKAVQTLHQPYEFGFALPTACALPVDLAAKPTGRLVLGDRPNRRSFPAGAPGAGRQWYYGSGAIRYSSPRSQSSLIQAGRCSQRVLEIRPDGRDLSLSRFAELAASSSSKRRRRFAQSPTRGSTIQVGGCNYIHPLSKEEEMQRGGVLDHRT